MLKTPLETLNAPAPRYTSYPTAPYWHPLEPCSYIERLATVNTPLSLYIHIPFCEKMCLFCGCSVILNRKAEKEIEYIDFLCQEIDLVASKLQGKKRVIQLHIGGGTPTKLAPALLEKLWFKLKSVFEIDLTGEIAIEIDPRTVVEDQGMRLKLLKSLGFNRVSFGVQDTNEKVQEAIKRNQSEKMTVDTYYLAQSLDFDEINIDLIYGLPFQTLETFKKTLDVIVQLLPDRIALFSYAKIPWLKPHQKAIKEETLPATAEKFAIYQFARAFLVSSGYTAIGMDHFALKESALAKSYASKKLYRNFQGYSIQESPHLIGLGVTSIGYIQGSYVQNHKELSQYYSALKQENLPVFRGKILSNEDLLRKWVIEKLMCSFEIDKELFYALFSKTFDSHFQDSQPQLNDLEEKGLIQNFPEKLVVTKQGELFIRNIAMQFDAYLKEPSSQPQFSQSI